jgi:hypothetical protein
VFSTVLDSSCTLHGVKQNSVIAVAMTSCGPTLPSEPMADTFGLSYTAQSGAGFVSFTTHSCNFRQHQLIINFGCVGSHSGDDVVTQPTNTPVGYNPAIIAAEFSGVTCTSDGTGVNNPSIGTGTGTQSAGNLTTTAIYDLIVGASLSNGIITVQAPFVAAPGVGSPYVFISQEVVDWGGDCIGAGGGGGYFCTMYMSMEYRVVATAGTYAVPFVFSTGNQDAGAVGSAWGPGTGPQPPHRVKEIKYRRRNPWHMNSIPIRGGVRRVTWTRPTRRASPSPGPS